MEAALIEPNTLKDNASPEAVVPHPEPTPRLVSAAIPESSAPLHFANTRTHPQTTKVNKKPLPSLRHGFQQEIKGSKPDINDLKHVKEPSINHLLQPVKGPALKRRQVAKPSLQSLVRATYTLRGQAAQSLTPPPHTNELTMTGTNQQAPIHPQGKYSIKDIQPSPRAWAAQMARCGLEIIEGTRPLSQMTRWASPQAYRYLEQRRNAISSTQKPQPGLVDAKQRRVSPVRVLSAHSRATSPTTHEAVIVLSDGQRTRAAALTLENRCNQWMIAAIRLG